KPFKAFHIGGAPDAVGTAWHKADHICLVGETFPYGLGPSKAQRLVGGFAIRHTPSARRPLVQTKPQLIHLSLVFFEPIEQVGLRSEKKGLCHAGISPFWTKSVTKMAFEKKADPDLLSRLHG